MNRKKKGQVMAMSVIIGVFFLAIAIGVGAWRERRTIGVRSAR